MSGLPLGYASLTPHLFVRGAAAAVDFYVAAFGAYEVLRTTHDDRVTVLHAELDFGGSPLFLAEEVPDEGLLAPESVGGTPGQLHLYSNSPDDLFARALGLGASVLTPMHEAYWGERYGRLRDPFGHHWALAAPATDLSPAEVQRRAARWLRDRRS